jgi:TIR domain
MIFVSYCHHDARWRQRFDQMSKPLSRATNIEFWSDQKIKAGEWEKQIATAMDTAKAAVLLVSPAFLASDYIMKKELPCLLEAHDKRELMVFWFYLEPCDLRWAPEITRFQAVARGGLKPLASLTDWEWKGVMVHGCGMIDDFLKSSETPVINPAIKNTALEKRTASFPLLAKPAERFVEVLVYSSDKKWWRQWGVKPGSCDTTIQLGDDRTPKGTRFKVIALTTYEALRQANYLNIPDHRTKSPVFTLSRK